jgi:hypothetical protein
MLGMELRLNRDGSEQWVKHLASGFTFTIRKCSLDPRLVGTSSAAPVGMLFTLVHAFVLKVLHGMTFQEIMHVAVCHGVPIFVRYWGGGVVCNRSRATHMLNKVFRQHHFDVRVCVTRQGPRIIFFDKSYKRDKR